MSQNANRNVKRWAERSSGSAAFALLGLALVLLLGWAAPRPAAAAEDAGLWMTAQASHSITEDWSAALWAQGRLENKFGEADQLLVMPSVHLRVIPSLKLGAGFVYWARRNSDEVQFMQEAAFSHRLADLQVGNRFRLEQRFINDRNDMILRGRYRLRFAHPLGDRGVYAVAGDEIFVNFDNENEGSGPPHGYEQNRVFGGLGFRFSNDWRVEVGYMWRNFFRRGEGDRRDDHFLTLSIFVDTKASGAGPEPLR